MKVLLSLLLATLALNSFSQGNSEDSAWIRENYYKIERYIPMRDGVKLFTSIYIPRDSSEQHPILMSRTPYSCAPYGENEFLNYYRSYQRYYFREGYIMV